MGLYFSTENTRYITPIVIGIPVGYMIYSYFNSNTPTRKKLEYKKNRKIAHDINIIENYIIENDIGIVDRTSQSYHYLENYQNKIDENSVFHKILLAPNSVRYNIGYLKNGNIYGEEWKNVYNIKMNYLDNRLLLDGKDLRIYRDRYSNYSFEYDISYANSNKLSSIFDILTVSITKIDNYTNQYNINSLQTIDKNIDETYNMISFKTIKTITNTNHLLEINRNTCLKYHKLSIDRTNNYIPLNTQLVEPSEELIIVNNLDETIDNTNIRNHPIINLDKPIEINNTLDETKYIDNLDETIDRLDKSIYKLEETIEQNTNLDETMDNLDETIEIKPINSLYNISLNFNNKKEEIVNTLIDIENTLDDIENTIDNKKDNNSNSKHLDNPLSNFNIELSKNKLGNRILNIDEDRIFIEIFFNKTKLVSIKY